MRMVAWGVARGHARFIIGHARRVGLECMLERRSGFATAHSSQESVDAVRTQLQAWGFRSMLKQSVEQTP